jgi:hypothetical protein
VGTGHPGLAHEFTRAARASHLHMLFMLPC